MMPVLAHMGHITYNLPTALVSNTLDYGKFEIQDTTHFMRNTLKVWQEFGFTFDAISTGFIVSPAARRGRRGRRSSSIPSWETRGISTTVLPKTP